MNFKNRMKNRLLSPRLADNLPKIYFFNASYMFLVIMPIVVLFWQHHGLNMEKIFLLQSIFGIALFVFEVPSGYFSDLLGRKKS